MISREKMIALYSAMVKHRAFAAQAEVLAHQGNLSASWQLAAGREAIVAGITADLRPDDSFLATQSKLAAAFIACARSKSPFNLASTNGHARNGHVPASVLAETFSAAVKAAGALKTSKDDAISLIFCEGRIKADLWRRQLQYISRNNLPLVLVRSAPKSASVARNGHAAPQALAFGVPRIAVDASDVLAVHRVAGEAIARARHRRGPTLIDCMHAHVSGNPASIADPIHAMETALVRKRILNAALKQEIERRVTGEANKALAQIVS